MFTIEKLSALEILDSRGRPTVQVTCRLNDATIATASVPSGASTGTAEAHELRDRDLRRYLGFGCQQAVAHVNEELNDALAGRAFPYQAQLDLAMLDLDGTNDKSRLGANAILAVSIAFARAAAKQRGVRLYCHLAGLLSTVPSTLPCPMINLFSGGKHAGAQIPIQDLLIVPTNVSSMDEALTMAFAVYHAAADLCQKKYGMRLLRADEGGLAPDFPNAEAMFDDALCAIEAAGLKPGHDVMLAVDVAASQFHRDGHYHLETDILDGAAMIDRLVEWVSQYPIFCLEDGLAEEDWHHWPQLCQRLSGRAVVLGDDLLCTNPQRIRRAADKQAANALLLKVNQIGTLTEAAEACQLARSAGWQVVISARSGETEDDWLADLAVGWCADQIKIGSITQSDRLSKYNRLLQIEAETGWSIVTWPKFSAKSDQ